VGDRKNVNPIKEPVPLITPISFLLEQVDGENGEWQTQLWMITFTAKMNTGIMVMEKKLWLTSSVS